MGLGGWQAAGCGALGALGSGVFLAPRPPFLFSPSASDSSSCSKDTGALRARLFGSVPGASAAAPPAPAAVDLPSCSRSVCT